MVVPIVSVDDRGGNPVPGAFMVEAELLQNGNISMQVLRVCAVLCVS